MKTPTRETIAVGTTRDGTVVFCDLRAHADILRLIPGPASRTGEPTPIAMIDELAALSKPKLDDLTRKAFDRAREERES